MTDNQKTVALENIALLERVRKLIDEGKSAKGWYGEAFTTAFVGLSFLDGKDKRRWKDLLSSIKAKLEQWLSKGGTDGSFGTEYDIAGLALLATFFKKCNNSQDFENAKKAFLTRFEGEVNRWKAFAQSKREPRLHIFKEPFYLYSVVVGLDACDSLGLYSDFLKMILEKEQNVNPFVEQAKLILSDHSHDSYAEILQAMIEVKPEDLKDHEVIPAFWLIANNLEGVQAVFPEDSRLKIAEEKAGDLYKMLFRLVQSSNNTKIHVSELALLNSVLGSRSKPLLVIPEAELAYLLNKKLGRKRLVRGITELIFFAFLLGIAVYFRSDLIINFISIVGFSFFLTFGAVDVLAYAGKEISHEEIATLGISIIFTIIFFFLSKI